MGEPEITDDDVFQVVEIIPNRLIFCPCSSPPEDTDEIFYFTIDHDPFFEYHPFFKEFGPPSILQIHGFYKLMLQVLEARPEKIQYFCFDDAFKFTTAVCLICCFQILYTGASAADVFRPFAHLEPCFMPFGDASLLKPTHLLRVPFYLAGFAKGVKHGWYNPSTFDENVWAWRWQPENGDMNWIIPGKLLAFASPWTHKEVAAGLRVCVVKDLIEPFKEMGITHIVRLNERLYDERDFKRAGFRHTELYFSDGGVPPMKIRDAWLRIINGKDVVALHCKAGLGRTGTLAGIYLVKRYGFTGDEAIGWIRICRPGSIMGPQQQYLANYTGKDSPIPQSRKKPTRQVRKPIRTSAKM